ncbi:MAG: hypothetical protein M1837_000355 [Sclerophora amabilis]|nr:MAG: hypothetical protein M1837_000355 [Sclerophora amabilis]
MPLWSFSPATRASLKDADQSWVSKFGLRVGAALVSLISLMLFAVALNLFGQNGAGQDGHDMPLLEAVWPMIPLSWSLLWFFITTTILITLQRPMSPIGILVVDGVAFGCLLGFSFWALILGRTEPANSDHSERSNNIRRQIKCERVGAIIGIIASGLHLILMVCAVMDVSKRRKAKRRAAIAAGSGWPRSHYHGVPSLTSTTTLEFAGRLPSHRTRVVGADLDDTLLDDPEDQTYLKK